MTEPSADFAGLLERARAGDNDALARLAERYEPKIRIVARVLLGAALRPYLDSIDVVQSVHRSLMVGLRGGKFDLSAPENLVALAVTVLRRKVARQWRKLQKQQRLSRCDAPVQDGKPAEPWDARPRGGDDPAREAEFRDAARRLSAALSESEQQMLQMRLEGCSTDEMAARLGINPIALRVRLTRLRKRLVESGAMGDWL